jgi:hypothetical protein
MSWRETYSKTLTQQKKKKKKGGGTGYLHHPKKISLQKTNKLQRRKLRCKNLPHTTITIASKETNGILSCLLESVRTQHSL